VEVWLVRHGQTEENLTHTIAGQGPSKLTPFG
jgi:broad specificity phosphatase PhoE